AGDLERGDNHGGPRSGHLDLVGRVAADRHDGAVQLLTGWYVGLGHGVLNLCAEVTCGELAHERLHGRVVVQRHRRLADLAAGPGGRDRVDQLELDGVVGRPSVATGRGGSDVGDRGIARRFTRAVV